MNIKKWFFNRWFRWFPPEVVMYWRKKSAERAYVTNEGHYQMIIDGEKYPYPGLPRGFILSSILSKLKHNAKTLFFNNVWQKLEDKVPKEEIIAYIKNEAVEKFEPSVNDCRFYALPHEQLCPPVKELDRALTLVERKWNDKRIQIFRKALVFIMQEDDGYRFRIQWLAQFFKPKTIQKFIWILEFMEHAEVVDDMKGRIKLLRTILKLILEDRTFHKLFADLNEAIDWQKLKLSKADKYYFRAKWFKVDLNKFDY